MLIQGAHVTCSPECHGHGCTDAEECAPRAVIGAHERFLYKRMKTDLYTSIYSNFLNLNMVTEGLVNSSFVNWSSVDALESSCFDYIIK